MHVEVTPSERDPVQQATEQQDSFCFKCGAQLRVDACFCSRCGCTVVEDKRSPGESEPTGSPEPPQAPAPHATPPGDDVNQEDHSRESNEVDGREHPCPTCKAALPRSARYCVACGSAVVDKVRLALVRLSKEGPKQVAELGSDELRLGKDERCQVQLPDDRYVSRMHAAIKQSGGKLTVEDLGSSNGTYIQLRRPYVLEAGDVIVVGTNSFRVDRAV